MYIISSSFDQAVLIGDGAWHAAHANLKLPEGVYDSPAHVAPVQDDAREVSCRDDPQLAPLRM
jgi:hypothetical protein